MKSFLVSILFFSCFCSNGELALLDEQFSRYTNFNTWNNLRIKTVAFDTNSCAYREGCVSGSGQRKLLGLTITIYNKSVETNGLWKAPTNQTLYAFDSCHNHIHLQDFSKFELLNSHGLVAAGRKIGWCVQSLYRVNDLGWNTNGSEFNCSSPSMAPGWADTYQFEGQPCMYLDITDVPDDYYTLRITIDPLRLFNGAYDSISRVVKIIGTNVASFKQDFKLENRQGQLWLIYTNVIPPWILQMTEDFTLWKSLLIGTTNLSLHTVEFRIENSNDWKFYRITTNL